MLRRTAGLLLAQELAPGALGDFAVSVAAMDAAESVATDPQFLGLLNFVRMGTSFLNNFRPRLRCILHRDRVRAKSRARIAEVRGHRLPAPKPMFTPALSVIDRLNLTLLVGELRIHAGAIKSACEHGGLLLPAGVLSQLVSVTTVLAAELDGLWSTLQGAGFPVDVAEKRLKDVGGWFEELAGVPAKAEPDLSRRARCYADASAALFEPCVHSSAVALDCMSWRRSYLSMRTGLRSGNHVSHGYPLDDAALFRLWCFMEIGAGILRAGRAALLSRFALAPQNGEEPRNYCGASVAAGAEGLLAETCMALIADPPKALSVVVSTHFGAWSYKERHAALGLTVTTGGQRGLLVASGGRCARESTASAEQSTTFSRVPLPPGASCDFYQALLIPDVAHGESNAATVARIVEHALG